MRVADYVGKDMNVEAEEIRITHGTYSTLRCGCYQTTQISNRSFMERSKSIITDVSMMTCYLLIELQEDVAKNLSFRSNLFDRISRKFQGRNKAKIIQGSRVCSCLVQEKITTNGDTHHPPDRATRGRMDRCHANGKVPNRNRISLLGSSGRRLGLCHVQDEGYEKKRKLFRTTSDTS